jgi:FkbM family methyltransferase
MTVKEALIRRVAIALRPVTNRLEYTVKSGVAEGLKRRGGLGFFHRPPTVEEQFVRSLNLRGRVIYEIGAYEGIFTIYFASQATRVIVFEPHPVNQKTLSNNVALNGFTNVTLRPVGLGSRRQDAVLVYPRDEPARASIEPAVSAAITREGGHYETIPVTIDTLDEQIVSADLPPPSFIKIDAEGAEYDILVGARNTLQKHRPDLMIEIHGAGGDARSHARRIAALLENIGYALSHVEDGSRVDSATAPGNLGHIFAVRAPGVTGTERP